MASAAVLVLTRLFVNVAVRAVDDIRIWSVARAFTDVRATVNVRLGRATPNLLAAYYFDFMPNTSIGTQSLLNHVTGQNDAVVYITSGACFVPLSAPKILCGDGIRGAGEVCAAGDRGYTASCVPPEQQSGLLSLLPLLHPRQVFVVWCCRM